MIQKRIVGVIGTGKVGMAAAYAMFLRQTAGEIILVDKDRYRAQGEAMDLMHGQPYVGNILVRAGDIADLGAAQVVVLAAGAAQRPGEKRTDLLDRNVVVFREIIEGLDRCAPNAVLVVASNPVDIITHAAQMLSRRPSGRIVGTGTMLDSARFRALLGEHYGVDPRSVHAYIIGEHGDTEVPVWSSALIGSLPIAGTTVLGRTFDADLMKNLFGRVRDAAADIIARKGYTSSAIGIVIARLVEAIMEDQKPVLTVSARLDGEYGLEDVCLSLPRVVGLSGVEAAILPRLDETEMQGLADSAAFLRRTLEAMTTAHLP
jgi:L-lactate dehydrogenase